MSACKTGIECTGNALAGGLSWVAGIFAHGKDTVENAIKFAIDPLGFLTHEVQTAVQAVAGILIPWIIGALHPKYDAQWWLHCYTTSFSISMFVLAIQLLVILTRRRRGSLGAKEALQSIFVAAPAFFIGASLGPVIGISLTKLFTAAGDAVAAWAINSTVEDFFTKIGSLAASGDATALLGSAFVSLLVLGTLFLSMLGMAFIFILQLAAQYLVGAVLPLGFVWIVNPDTRKIGKAVPVTWLLLPATQVALILLVGIAFRAINGISITADPGTLGNLVDPIQHFVNLAVPAIISFIVVFAPISMLKFIPRPGGGAGTARTSGFTPPQVAPQIPQSPSRAPQSPHQSANSGGQPFQWKMPTSMPEPAGGHGYGGSMIGAAGKTAGGQSVTVNAAGTAGKHAATAAAGKAGTAAAAGGKLGGAAAAGTAATGVGAPLAVGMLLANSALRVAQQASQAASTAADQAVEHGHHQEA